MHSFVEYILACITIKKIVLQFSACKSPCISSLRLKISQLSFNVAHTLYRFGMIVSNCAYMSLVKDIIHIELFKKCKYYAHCQNAEDGRGCRGEFCGIIIKVRNRSRHRSQGPSMSSEALSVFSSDFLNR